MLREFRDCHYSVAVDVLVSGDLHGHILAARGV